MFQYAKGISRSFCVDRHHIIHSYYITLGICSVLAFICKFFFCYNKLYYKSISFF